MEKANAKDYLGKEVSIEIDRPMGTRHPKHGFMYMINYGFIPNTISGDGEELDAYLVQPKNVLLSVITPTGKASASISLLMPTIYPLSESSIFASGRFLLSSI